MLRCVCFFFNSPKVFSGFTIGLGINNRLNVCFGSQYADGFLFFPFLFAPSASEL